MDEKNGLNVQSIPVCEGLFSQLSWIFMIPVFIYWFYLQIKGKTIFPKAYVFTNIIFIFYGIENISNKYSSKCFSSRIFIQPTNESMIIWFGIMLKFIRNQRNRIE